MKRQLVFGAAAFLLPVSRVVFAQTVTLDGATECRAGPLEAMPSPFLGGDTLEDKVKRAVFWSSCAV